MMSSINPGYTHRQYSGRSMTKLSSSDSVVSNQTKQTHSTLSTRQSQSTKASFSSSLGSDSVRAFKKGIREPSQGQLMKYNKNNSTTVVQRGDTTGEVNINSMGGNNNKRGSLEYILQTKNDRSLKSSTRRRSSSGAIASIASASRGDITTRRSNGSSRRRNSSSGNTMSRDHRDNASLRHAPFENAIDKTTDGSSTTRIGDPHHRPQSTSVVTSRRGRAHQSSSSSTGQYSRQKHNTTNPNHYDDNIYHNDEADSIYEEAIRRGQLHSDSSNRLSRETNKVNIKGWFSGKHQKRTQSAHRERRKSGGLSLQRSNSERLRSQSVQPSPRGRARSDNSMYTQQRENSRRSFSSSHRADHTFQSRELQTNYQQKYYEGEGNRSSQRSLVQEDSRNISGRENYVQQQERRNSGSQKYVQQERRHSNDNYAIIKYSDTPTYEQKDVTPENHAKNIFNSMHENNIGSCDVERSNNNNANAIVSYDNREGSVPNHQQHNSIPVGHSCDTKEAEALYDSKGSGNRRGSSNDILLDGIDLYIPPSERKNKETKEQPLEEELKVDEETVDDHNESSCSDMVIGLPLNVVRTAQSIEQRIQQKREKISSSKSTTSSSGCSKTKEHLRKITDKGQTCCLPDDIDDINAVVRAHDHFDNERRKRLWKDRQEVLEKQRKDLENKHQVERQRFQKQQQNEQHPEQHGEVESQQRDLDRRHQYERNQLQEQQSQQVHHFQEQQLRQNRYRQQDLDIQCQNNDLQLVTYQDQPNQHHLYPPHVQPSANDWEDDTVMEEMNIQEQEIQQQQHPGSLVRSQDQDLQGDGESRVQQREEQPTISQQQEKIEGRSGQMKKRRSANRIQRTSSSSSVNNASVGKTNVLGGFFNKSALSGKNKFKNRCASVSGGTIFSRNSIGQNSLPANLDVHRHQFRHQQMHFDLQGKEQEKNDLQKEEKLPSDLEIAVPSMVGDDYEDYDNSGYIDDDLNSVAILELQKRPVDHNIDTDPMTGKTRSEDTKSKKTARRQKKNNVVKSLLKSANSMLDKPTNKKTSRGGEKEFHSERARRKSSSKKQQGESSNSNGGMCNPQPNARGSVRQQETGGEVGEEDVRMSMAASAFGAMGLTMNGMNHSDLAKSAIERSKQDMKDDIAARNEDLLFDVFPRHVAECLRDGRKVEPEARECATVFFSDIVGYTTLCSQLTPIQISSMLDRLYSRFDELANIYGVFKIETIGDAYMAVTNLATDQTHTHVKMMAKFSIDAVEAANKILIDEEEPAKGCVQIRVGFHAGPIVANVVGTRLPKYTIFGDAVNVAARMEANSMPGRIQCSDSTAMLLMQQAPEIPLTYRGKISLKGKGEMDTFFVNETPH